MVVLTRAMNDLFEIIKLLKIYRIELLIKFSYDF